MVVNSYTISSDVTGRGPAPLALPHRPGRPRIVLLPLRRTRTARLAPRIRPAPRRLESPGWPDRVRLARPRPAGPTASGWPDRVRLARPRPASPARSVGPTTSGQLVQPGQPLHRTGRPCQRLR